MGREVKPKPEKKPQPLPVFDLKEQGTVPVPTGEKAKPVN